MILIMKHLKLMKGKYDVHQQGLSTREVLKFFIDFIKEADVINKQEKEGVRVSDKWYDYLEAQDIYVTKKCLFHFICDSLKSSLSKDSESQ